MYYGSALRNLYHYWKPEVLEVSELVEHKEAAQLKIRLARAADKRKVGLRHSFLS